jgi:hypothetical protein
MSMSLQTLILDFDGSAATLAIGAASVNVAVPANSELVGISATGNAHFHFGDGSGITATNSDPVVTPNSGMLIVRVPPPGTGATKYFAIIQDGSSTGNVNICRVKEG